MLLSLVPSATYDMNSSGTPLGSRMSLLYLQQQVTVFITESGSCLVCLMCRGATAHMKLLLRVLSCAFGHSFVGHVFSVLQFLLAVLPVLDVPTVSQPPVYVLLP